MIHNLEPYPGYRDTGLPWIGELPEHWKAPRLKTVFHEVDQRSGTGVEPLLSLRMREGLVDHHETGGKRVPAASLTHYKVTRPGELVMNRMRAAIGLFGLPPKVGLVSPDYAVLRPRMTVELRYFLNLFRSPGMMSIFRLESHGLGTGESGFLRLYTEQFGTIPTPLPPLPEQVAIVRFLDHADRRIRRYIAAKKKLIALLNEQKQTAIHRAVTRGLDPFVSTRPSGVEWLGEVPEHWEVAPLRRRWTVTDCKHLTVPFVEEGIPLASVREVQSFDLDLSTSKRTATDWYETLIGGGRAPRRGDVIYCRNVSVGAAAFVSTDAPFAMGQDVCLIRSANQNQRYLNYFLHSPAMDRELAMLLVGSTFKRINVSDIKGLIIAMPPRAEQDAIAAHLDQELEHLERPISDAHLQIGLMREYRARLIADVVTGKLDVREAAVRLPNENDEPEPSDDADALAEGDESENEADLGTAAGEAEA